MEDIFELLETGFTIKDETIMLVLPFNKIYKRDKSRVKRNAYKELHYVFNMSDIRSNGVKRGLEGNKLHLYSKEAARLDDDWKPDKVINDAIEYYKNARSNIAIVAYENLLKSLSIGNDTVTLLGDIMRDQLERSASQDNDARLTSEEIKLIVASLKELLVLSTDLPKRVKELKAIKDQALKSNTGAKLARGGVTIEDSMNPNRIT